MKQTEQKRYITNYYPKHLFIYILFLLFPSISNDVVEKRKWKFSTQKFVKQNI